MGTFTLKGLAPYSSTVRREIVIDASHLQEKTKVRQSKQATLNINGSAVAQQRSITHSSALQSGEITVENSDWPTICSLSFDSSALSWPQWASVFVFMLPYSFFFLTHWVNSLLRIFLAGKHRHTATWEVQRQVRHML